MILSRTDVINFLFLLRSHPRRHIFNFPSFLHVLRESEPSSLSIQQQPRMSENSSALDWMKVPAFPLNSLLSFSVCTTSMIPQFSVATDAADDAASTEENGGRPPSGGLSVPSPGGLFPLANSQQIAGGSATGTWVRRELSRVPLNVKCLVKLWDFVGPRNQLNWINFPTFQSLSYFFFFAKVLLQEGLR